MRETIIESLNMIMARANANGDIMLRGLAYTLAIMNKVNYSELDPEVWREDEFNLSTGALRFPDENPH